MVGVSPAVRATGSDPVVRLHTFSAPRRAAARLRAAAARRGQALQQFGRLSRRILPPAGARVRDRQPEARLMEVRVERQRPFEVRKASTRVARVRHDEAKIAADDRIVRFDLFRGFQRPDRGLRLA